MQPCWPSAGASGKRAGGTVQHLWEPGSSGIAERRGPALCGLVGVVMPNNEIMFGRGGKILEGFEHDRVKFEVFFLWGLGEGRERVQAAAGVQVGFPTRLPCFRRRL